MRTARVLAALAAWLTLPSVAFAWEIASFETRVAVHRDATATVTETIVADFTGESRHGLYRDIPIHYTDRAGQHFTLRLRVLSVTDDQGEPWRFHLESAGRYRRIRIGDPDRTVTGRQTYRITYDVQRGAVRFFPDHDECYWNLTGNEWAVPMRRVRAEIELPALASDLRAVAYVGGYGSTARLDSPRVAGDRVILEPPRSFDPYEGLTAAVAWEKGIVHPPALRQVLGWWLQDNWIYGIPLLALLLMTWLWWLRGRDPRLAQSEVVQYEPPERFTPAEVGTLMDQRADLRDITATVIDLAVRGYLRIEPLTSSAFGMSRVSDYRLVSLKPRQQDGALKPHERTLLGSLFVPPATETNLSELEQTFYVQVPKIRNHLYESLIASGYLDSHPDKVRKRYLIGGVALGAALSHVLLSQAARLQMGVLPAVLAALLSGLIIVLFGLVMPRRTLKGARATQQSAGFLEFLRRVDQDRIRRLNDPALFERYLPYALAFGVAGQWARAFEGIYTQPPSWYGGQWDTFSPTRLGHDLNLTMASMGQTFTSQPRSSGSFGGSGVGGGGFSGGGGGGGGGGAW